MGWDCPSCGFNGNDDDSLRCSCGHELVIQVPPPNYNKIDGALILVACGLVISIILSLSAVIDPAPRVNSNMRLAATIIGVLIALIPITLLIMLFRKKKRLPLLIRLYYLMNLAVAYINYFSTKSLPDVAGKIRAVNTSFDVLAITFISCCIWVTYFSVSTRVKKTFIR